MNHLKLAGEHGSLELRFDGACGTVGYTESGDQCRTTVTITSWNYRAEGKVWCEREALNRFGDQLRKCYEAVSGVASFRSTEGHLAFQVAFAPRTGNVTIEGTFQETFAEGTELRFRIQTDQSFVAAALPEPCA